MKKIKQYFKNLDDLHYNFQEIDGYNLPFNFIVSPREPGKTTNFLLFKCYLTFIEKGETLIYLVRNATEITAEFISSIESQINKFLITPIEIKYRLSSLTKSIVDVFVNDKHFIRFISLNAPIVRIKKTIINNPSYIFMDEFIINPEFKETYLPGEFKRFKEVYTTYRRSKENLKCYFCGNPYSLYNPYFVGFGINTKLLKPGARIVNKNVIVQCYELKPELIEYILKVNPLYQFDDSYKNYALNGIAVNDLNIPLCEKVQGFSLQYIFRYDNSFLGVWRKNLFLDDDKFKYWVSDIKDFSKRREVLCFDFNEMIEGTSLYSREDKLKLYKIVNAMNKRLIYFDSIPSYYMFVEIYKFL